MVKIDCEWVAKCLREEVRKGEALLSTLEATRDGAHLEDTAELANAFEDVRQGVDSLMEDLQCKISDLNNAIEDWELSDENVD